MNNPTRAVPKEIRGKAFNILWISAKSSRNHPRGCCEWSNADFASQDEIGCSPTAVSRTVSNLVQRGLIEIAIRNGSDREIRLTEAGWAIIENKEREIEERKLGRGPRRGPRKGLAISQATQSKRSADCQAPQAERPAPPGDSARTPGKTPGLLNTPATPQHFCAPEPTVWRRIKATLAESNIPALVSRFLDPLVASLQGNELHLSAPNAKISAHVKASYLRKIKEVAAKENIVRVFLV